MDFPKVGVPHIRAEIKAARASNYTLNKAFNDLIDNVIYKASKIYISIEFNNGDQGDDSQELYRIKIHDDYEKGFENIENNDENNPFNFGHERPEHKHDDETSEFGKGMKYAAMFLGERFEVYTKVKGRYWKVHFDFNDMRNSKTEASKSYQPKEYKNISENEYKQFHKVNENIILDNGSTIIIEHIRKKSYFAETPKQLIDSIKKNILKCYNKILTKKDIEIFIDNDKIEPQCDTFENPFCKKLISSTNVSILNKDINNFVAVAKYKSYDSNSYHYLLFNKDTLKTKIAKKVKQSNFTEKDYSEEINKYNSKDIKNLEFKTTFLYYLNKLNDENEDNITNGKINVFRKDRCYDIKNKKI